MSNDTQQIGFVPIEAWFPEQRDFISYFTKYFDRVIATTLEICAPKERWPTFLPLFYGSFEPSTRYYTIDLLVNLTGGQGY